MAFSKSTSPPDDLRFCKGSQREKLAMLESKSRPQQQSTPDLCHIGRNPVAVRRTHSEDIKERVLLLEKALTKAKYTRDTSDHKRMDKNDPEYGRPQKGTWTAERGEKAHNHVHKEILELCEFIYMHSDEEEEEDQTMTVMLFGDLFKLYTRISDKVVGILLRARKYGLVHFEPEILFQGQDDNEPIYLMKPMAEIYEIYNEHKSFSHLIKPTATTSSSITTNLATYG